MKIIYTAIAAVALSAFFSVSAPTPALAGLHHQPPPPTCKVAEPATLILLGSALSGLGIAKRLKKS